MINPAMIFRLKSSWEKFTASHPKFPMFLQAAVNNKPESVKFVNRKPPKHR